MIISSDGHATARMDDYREYVDPAFREEFDEFCVVYREKGSKSSDPKALKDRLDPEVLDAWLRDVLEPGRVDGLWNAERRLQELEGEGVCAEVLIPDFGLPFELYSPGLAAHLNQPMPDAVHVDVANRAYNRWLRDFVSLAPERFAPMAAVSFADVPEAIREIRWAKDAGFKGVMFPMFTEELPLFDTHFDPIWSTLEDLDLPLCSHISISATTTKVWNIKSVPHPACHEAIRQGVAQFFCRQVLDHLILGGVFERHPRLRIVFTEQGSGWIASKLEAMDYSYSGSYMRRDIRDVIKRAPSEYFARQCWIGSSLLSKAEVEYRQSIGVDKMMVGVDYPHHEGTWNGGTQDYLQATFGAAEVPEREARMMLGETAAKVYGFDTVKLAEVVNRIGPSVERILTPPTEDRFPRGDVHKPLAGNLL